MIDDQLPKVLPHRGFLPAALLLLLAGASACGGHGDVTAVSEIGGDFISVRKALKASRSPVAGPPRNSDDFYIGIKKSLLGERWFLSALVKQFYPDNQPLVGALGITDTDQLLADTPLGTRVVSFEVQNDRLYLLDASDRYRQTPLQDPTVLLEAYPIVESSEIDGLPRSDEYVLFDPAQGSSELQLTGELFSDPHLVGAWPLEVGLAFSRNFRVLSDGAAFEEVFSGQFDAGEEVGVLSAWGTLGIALRRYREGAHYTATPDPGIPHYFTNFRYAPDGSGQLQADAPHWDFYPGMTPVQIFVSAGADRAQEAYPNVDVFGAITSGIESWNDVFGFPVFEAVLTHDDRIREDGSSYLLVDYPSPNTTALGWSQINPNTGEILSANVYLPRGAFDDLDRLGLGPSSEPVALARPLPASRPRLGVGWSGVSPQRALCDRGGELSLAGSASHPAQASVSGSSEDAPLPEQGRAALEYYVTHEIGHTLGLRHNFKGSLLPPGGTSVMDYQGLRDAIALPEPGSYDIEAIRYLYQLSPELPTDPFCTDEDTAFDPTCGLFDEGADPLVEFWGPMYIDQVSAVLDAGGSVDDLTALDGVLSFARDDAAYGFVSPEQRVAALQLALGGAAVPLSADDAAEPARVAAANLIANRVLRRAVLDPPEARGSIQADLSDPGVLAYLIEQTGQLLVNADGVRTFAVRRTAVDTLAALQTDDALVVLLDAQDHVAATLAAGLSDGERQLTTDLLSRIQSALDPYFL